MHNCVQLSYLFHPSLEDIIFVFLKKIVNEVAKWNVIELN